MAMALVPARPSAPSAAHTTPCVHKGPELPGAGPYRVATSEGGSRRGASTVKDSAWEGGHLPLSVVLGLMAVACVRGQGQARDVGLSFLFCEWVEFSLQNKQQKRKLGPCAEGEGSLSAQPWSLGLRLVAPRGQPSGLPGCWVLSGHICPALGRT